jgi:hypothetical protein
VQSKRSSCSCRYRTPCNCFYKCNIHYLQRFFRILTIVFCNISRSYCDAWSGPPSASAALMQVHFILPVFFLRTPQAFVLCVFVTFSFDALHAPRNTASGAVPPHDVLHLPNVGGHSRVRSRRISQHQSFSLYLLS